jgi:hypothetical protein
MLGLQLKADVLYLRLVKMITRTIIKKIDCSKIDSIECSDIICNKIQNDENCKIRCDKVGDLVVGHLNIDHGYGHFEDAKRLTVNEDKNGKLIRELTSYKKYVSTGIIERDHKIEVCFYENKKDADDNRRNFKKIENIPSKNKIEKCCQDCIKEIEK